MSFRHSLSLDVQTAADFRLDLNPEDFANIPKEFNMRPHTDGAQSAYSFGHQHGGSVGELFLLPIMQSKSLLAFQLCF